jgi:hypothetical protein
MEIADRSGEVVILHLSVEFCLSYQGLPCWRSVPLDLTGSAMATTLIPRVHHGSLESGGRIAPPVWTSPPPPACPATNIGRHHLHLRAGKFHTSPGHGHKSHVRYERGVNMLNMPFAPSPSRLESRIVEAVRTAGNNSAESSNQNVQFSYAARVNAKLTEGPTIARISSSLRGPALPPSQHPFTFPCLGKAPAHRDGLCLSKFAALVYTRH